MSALLMIVNAIENNIVAATSMIITARSCHDSGRDGGDGATSVELDEQQHSNSNEKSKYGYLLS